MIRECRGQGIVEFAVIFPIFAILLFAVIDGGLVMGRYNQANQASGVGARTAATAGGDYDAVRVAAEDAVQKQMHDALDDPATCDGSGDDICVEFRTGPDGQPSGDIGSVVVVYVRHEYNLLTPLPGIDTWTIEACSVQRVERQVQDTGPDPEIGEC